ncbi:peptidase S8/S53 domain-containing protein [Xylariomycetidae sp. FL2044]|nr:peptidase S8/S53 domain-containing protein [Xylariomycetidae sp. FL2044]
MMQLVVTALLALGAAASTARADASANETFAAATDAAPRRYILELKSREHSQKVAEKVASVPGFRMVKHFDFDLFPAVSVECDHECDGDVVAAAFGDHREDSEDEPALASVYKSGTLRILTPYAVGESYSDDAAASNYSVHGITGVAALHEQGIVGEGAVVALVDSGVQYTHPALGGGIGPNFTVIGGYDLVGDGDWPNTPADPDSDPMDQYGHGTHVAGIVAGKSEQFVGVAPGAKLLSFKVFPASGYSNEETVIEAFLRAFDSGADIISASLGETSGFTTNAWAVVASRMVDQGVFVSIAIGNDGQTGPFDAANGASGVNVMTVASGEPGAYPAQGFTAVFDLDGVSNETQIAYLPGTNAFPSTVLDWPIVPLTLDSSVEDDACSTLPTATPDLSDRIVLVRIGGCSVSQKHDNIIPYNASYILFYNDDGPYVNPNTGRTDGLTGTIEASAGEAIVATIVAGGNVRASFDVDTAHNVGLHNAGAGRPALYTSWGSTYDLALKPDIAAPGSKILSTYPTDAYRVLSGTSMATPYIAGVAALWVGRHGGRAAHAGDPAWAKRLVARMTATAHAVPWADWSTSATDYGFWAPATQVGAGLVDAVKTLTYATELGFAGRKFELNDTAHFAAGGAHAVDIANAGSGSETVTYTFSLQDAGGYEAYSPSVPGQDNFFLPSIKLYSELAPVRITPGVVMPSGEFTVGPGETKTAEFIFTVPEDVNSTNLPVYSGKILISGSNGEELGIPYFGVACDLKETIEHNWDYGQSYPYIYSGYSGPRLDVKANFTFNLTREKQDFPHFISQLVWGSDEIRFDIFETTYTESQWTYPPTVGQNGYVGSATSWNGTDSSGWFTPGTDSEDDVFAFPRRSVPRNKRFIYYWLGRLANGTQIGVGDYLFRIAALKPFGMREVADDWDIWETPKITVLPMDV